MGRDGVNNCYDVENAIERYESTLSLLSNLGKLIKPDNLLLYKVGDALWTHEFCRFRALEEVG